MMIRQLCNWISQTRLSLFVQEVPWVIPTVQIVHILSIAVVISASVTMELRFLRASLPPRSVAAMTSRFFPWIWSALSILAITGGILISAEPARDLPNPVFQSKMALVSLVLANTLVLQHKIKRLASDVDPAGVTPAIKVIGFFSLIIWVSIIFAGRWIAYVDSR
jgi:hypothetical protein